MCHINEFKTSIKNLTKNFNLTYAEKMAKSKKVLK